MHTALGALHSLALVIALSSLWSREERSSWDILTCFGVDGLIAGDHRDLPASALCKSSFSFYISCIKVPCWEMCVLPLTGLLLYSVSF